MITCHIDVYDICKLRIKWLVSYFQLKQKLFLKWHYFIESCYELNDDLAVRYIIMLNQRVTR